MKDKKNDRPAVSTFADHEVIVPPNKLKKAVQKIKPGEKIPFDPVERAEAALDIAELVAVGLDGVVVEDFGFPMLQLSASGTREGQA